MTLRNLLPLTALGLIASLSSGCASLVTGRSTPVRIESEPVGAMFVVKNSEGDTVNHGVTPAKFSLEGGEGYFNPANYTITFEKPGYKTTTGSLDAKLNPWYFGNIIAVVCFVVIDPNTGAMWRFDDDVGDNGYLKVTMQSGNGAKTNAVTDGTGTAQDRLWNLDELKKQGLITDEEYQQRRKAILNNL